MRERMMGGAMVMAVLTVCCAQALAVTPGYVETFDTQAAANSWWAYVDGGYYYPGYVSSGDPYIYTPTDYYGGWLYAEASSSGGAFVGDYAAAGVTGIQVDAYCDNPANIDWVDVYLYSNYDSTFYMLSYILPDSSWYTLPAMFNDLNWFNNTTQSYEMPSAAALSQVTEVGVIAWGTNGALPTFINIDNFTLVPEPATLSLLAIGGLAALRRRR